MRRPKLFEGEAWAVRSPPTIKSFLINLNIRMDWILDKIREIEWSYHDPILWASGTTEIERLTLLLEDHRFYRHSGFDCRCIPRMLRQAITLKRIGGVSTIEQQLVRTLLERRERTIRRKLREILLAWILTHRKPKREILRTYLATAYFGYRLRGCDVASRIIFARDAENLGTSEAAFVASMLVYPLPKVALVWAYNTGRFPVLDSTQFLIDAAAVAPRWSHRMTRRIAYGLALRRNAK